MCVQSRMHFRVMIVIFFKCIYLFLLLFFFFKHYCFCDLVKAKPIRY